MIMIMVMMIVGVYHIDRIWSDGGPLLVLHPLKCSRDLNIILQVIRMCCGLLLWLTCFR